MKRLLLISLTVIATLGLVVGLALPGLAKTEDKPDKGYPWSSGRQLLRGEVVEVYYDDNYFTIENEDEGEIETTGFTPGTFDEKAGAEICEVGGKPVIRLFSTTYCSHCVWIKSTFDSVVQEYVDAGKIVAYHWELDTKDNTLTDAVETEVPASEEAVYREFNPKGTIPTFVFGCKYHRVGNGYEQEDDLAHVGVGDAPFFHAVDDRVEVVVGDDDLGGFARHVGTAGPHRHTHLCRAQRRRVIGAVAADCNIVPVALQRLHDVEFLRGFDTREHHRVTGHAVDLGFDRFQREDAPVAVRPGDTGSVESEENKGDADGDTLSEIHVDLLCFDPFGPW